MDNTPDDVQSRVDRFQEGLRQANVKLTHQRLEIFRELAGSEAHPDAETIFKGVRERLPMVSLDTVYRTLWLLLDLGLISTVGLPRERFRFDANFRPHHHFVCTRCGATSDFYSDVLDRLPVPEGPGAFGEAEGMQVEVRGICWECLESTNSAQHEEATT